MNDQFLEIMRGVLKLYILFEGIQKVYLSSFFFEHCKYNFIGSIIVICIIYCKHWVTHGWPVVLSLMNKIYKLYRRNRQLELLKKRQSLST